MAEDGVRASHEDRDRIVEVLRVAAGDGRLSAEELDQRIGGSIIVGPPRRTFLQWFRRERDGTAITTG